MKKEEKQIKSERKRKLSRREFLKLVTVAAAYAALPTILKTDTPKDPHGDLSEIAKGKEHEAMNSSILVLDSFESDTSNPWLLKGHLSFREILQYRKILRSMGVTDTSDFDNIKQITPTNEEEEKILMFLLLNERYKDHGSRVVDAGNKTSSFCTEKSRITPSHDCIGQAMKIIEFSYDEIGNPVIKYGLDLEKIKDMVKQSDSSIVNLSFQLGANSLTLKMFKPDPSRRFPNERKIETIISNPDGTKTTNVSYKYEDYDFNEIPKEEYDRLLSIEEAKPPIPVKPNEREIDFVDGYYGDHAAENLLPMLELALTFPDKCFFVAGGNPTGQAEIPDILVYRKVLEEKNQWPPNLYVIGVVDYKPETGNYGLVASYGADFYVSDEDLKKLDLELGSSFSTPIVSEIARLLVESFNLKTPQEIRIKLEELSSRQTYWYEDKEISYQALDINKAREIILSASK